MNINDRFWAKVDKRSPDDCWNWLGCKVNKDSNYGYFATYHGFQVRAHRFAYQITYGEIPDGMCVLHKCDNRTCVNPNHLFLGTQKDNIHDMLSKGRGQWNKRKARCVLDEEKVKSIISIYRDGRTTIDKIAEIFGMSYTGIWLVIHRRTWKNVPV